MKMNIKTFYSNTEDDNYQGVIYSKYFHVQCDYKSPANPTEYGNLPMWSQELDPQPH